MKKKRKIDVASVIDESECDDFVEIESIEDLRDRELLMLDLDIDERDFTGSDNY